MTVIEAATFLKWFRSEYPGYSVTLNLNTKSVHLFFRDISGLNCNVIGNYDLAGLRRAVDDLFEVP